MQTKDDAVVTDCWTAYQSWMQRVAEFRELVQLRDSEVWLEYEVSLGSPARPRVSAPFQIARGGGIQAALDRVATVMGQLLASLMASIEAATREVGALQQMRGDPQAIDDLERRMAAQRLLLERLEPAYRGAKEQPHPQVLVAWLEILREQLSAGDHRIWVEVRTTRLV
jgi:hypothetical protein